MPEGEPYLDILEDEILSASSALDRLQAYQALMSRIDDYPAGSTKFARIQALLLLDLVNVALDDEEGGLEDRRY